MKKYNHILITQIPIWTIGSFYFLLSYSWKQEEEYRNQKKNKNLIFFFLMVFKIKVQKVNKIIPKLFLKTPECLYLDLPFHVEMLITRKRIRWQDCSWMRREACWYYQAADKKIMPRRWHVQVGTTVKTDGIQLNSTCLPTPRFYLSIISIIVPCVSWDGQDEILWTSHAGWHELMTLI